MMRAPPRPLRVLIVDDCQDNRESLAMLLRLWGHEVCLAHDGPSALEASQAFQPQAVLLDIGLPGTDGWQVARRLREQQGDRPVLLVAVTGNAHEQARERSSQAGFDAHLSKPFESEEVRQLLAGALTPADAA